MAGAQIGVAEATADRIVSHCMVENTLQTAESSSASLRSFTGRLETLGNTGK